MESYIIHTLNFQGEKLVFAEINNLRDAPQSVKECRFQTIGWILHIYEQVNSLADTGEEVGQKGNIRIAFMEFASLDQDVSRELVRAENWRERFNLVWPVLSTRERAQALSYNYNNDDCVNYWPGFDTFNQILLGLSQDSADRKHLFGLPKNRGCA